MSLYEKILKKFVISTWGNLKTVKNEVIEKSDTITEENAEEEFCAKCKYKFDKMKNFVNTITTASSETEFENGLSGLKKEYYNLEEAEKSKIFNNFYGDGIIYVLENENIIRDNLREKAKKQNIENKNIKNSELIADASTQTPNLVAEVTPEDLDIPKEQKTDDEKINIEILCSKKLARAKELQEIANSTIDEKDFFLSLNEITRILYELASYEDKVDFIGSPSNDLKQITENREKIIDFFQERVRKDFDLMSGYEFENFCAKLLQKNGFENIEVTKESGDQGIDIIAFKDGIKYGIQCKCYSSDIGNKAVQEVFSGAKFYDCHVPVVLTNRHFTESAKELAKKTNVLLWDREYLQKLIKATEI